MAQNKNFSVSDLFEPVRGKSKYTREYSDKHAGEFPVYSASLAAPLCFINSYDYDGIYLTWTTNGYGGRLQIISGKFSINGDRGILIPKSDEVPDLDYIKYILEPVLIEQAVGRVVDGKKNEYTKVAPDVVANSIVVFPINDEGKIHLPKILETAERIKNIKKFQNSLGKHRDYIDNSEININVEGPFKTVCLNDISIFELSIGERVLKKDNKSSGIPVYSANVNKPFGFIEKSNIINFDTDSIIWGIDGNFAWNLIPKGTVFATTDHCGRLQLKINDIDPEYLFYMLQATRLEYGFDRVFRANLENIANEVHVNIPIDTTGKFCLNTQKEIAARFKFINSLKKATIEKLQALSSVQLDIAL